MPLPDLNLEKLREAQASFRGKYPGLAERQEEFRTVGLPPVHGGFEAAIRVLAAAAEPGGCNWWLTDRDAHAVVEDLTRRGLMFYDNLGQGDYTARLTARGRDRLADLRAAQA